MWVCFIDILTGITIVAQIVCIHCHRCMRSAGIIIGELYTISSFFEKWKYSESSEKFLLWWPYVKWMINSAIHFGVRYWRVIRFNSNDITCFSRYWPLQWIIICELYTSCKRRESLPTEIMPPKKRSLYTKWRKWYRGGVWREGGGSHGANKHETRGWLKILQPPIGGTKMRIA